MGRSRLLNPFSVFNKFEYFCSKNCLKFDVIEQQLLNNDKQYGIIVVDGQGFVIGIVRGSHKRILFKKNVDIPTNHNKGGQSSNRFLHTHQNTCHNYITNVIEYVKKYLLSKDANKLSVEGFVIAGAGEFKQSLADRLDGPLEKGLVDVITISKNGDDGFLEAVDKCELLFQDSNMTNIDNHLKVFFEKIDKCHKDVVYGKDLTIRALNEKLVKKLFVVDISQQSDDLNVEIVVVPISSVLSNRFLTGFGGYGAILHFPFDFDEECYEHYNECNEQCNEHIGDDEPDDLYSGIWDPSLDLLN